MTDQLPLPDYDDLPTAGIESRSRTLDEPGVQTLLDYERAHADRPAVVLVLQHRLEQLQGGAEPTGGSPGAPAPEAGHRADTPQASINEGPPQNPPSHGVPENTTQPRR